VGSHPNREFQKLIDAVSSSVSNDGQKSEVARMGKKLGILLVGFFVCMMISIPSRADQSGTKDEAVAMVKKVIEFYKANGDEKTFEEVCNSSGQFVDRDLYVIVFNMEGKCLAHGANPKMVGRELIDHQDVDGRPYIRERIEMMKKQATGWNDYKFRNPVNSQIEPKTSYNERYKDFVFVCGVYNPQ
jgi:cytochrome c